MEEEESVALSDLLKVKVFDADGRHIGHVQDMAVRADVGEREVRYLGVHLLWSDRVGAIELVRRAEDLVVLVPWSAVSRIDEDGIFLAETHPELNVETAAGKWLLRRDIMDKQMLDSEGNRIQRVDDVLLKFEQGRLILEGLEVSVGMLMSSSRLRQFLEKLKKKYASKQNSDVIPWGAVERIEEGELTIGETVAD